MDVYLVGGAVRDRLLQVEPKDYDYVVVGGTVEILRAAGYKQVGKDFPIFLNEEGNEVALARRARKGEAADFGPEVTLEEDLSKRDLTINAMAMESPNEDTFRLIDPFFGYDDLLNKVLRMVSAEAFMEDPIRVLRVARFAARYPDFRIDQNTGVLMRAMVKEGKLDNLVPERVWKELSRGLMEAQPSRMLQVLRECGALKVIVPELDALYGVPQPVQWHPEVDTGIHIEQALDVAAQHNFALEVRFAVMLHDLGKAVTPKEGWPGHHGHEAMGVDLVKAVCTRLKVPTVYEHIAVITAREHGNIHGAAKLKTTSIVKLLRRCDAFRRPIPFQFALQAAMCDAQGRWGETGSFRETVYPQPLRFTNALWAAKQVKGDLIAERCKGRPEYIAVEMHAARARAIKAFEYKQNTTL